MSASRPSGSFWGNPTLEPRDKDVARFLANIRELVENFSDQRALGLATSSLKAITEFVVERFGAKEALSLLDTMRGEILDRAGRQ